MYWRGYWRCGAMYAVGRRSAGKRQLEAANAGQPASNVNPAVGHRAVRRAASTVPLLPPTHVEPASSSACDIGTTGSNGSTDLSGGVDVPVVSAAPDPSPDSEDESDEQSRFRFS